MTVIEEKGPGGQGHGPKPGHEVHITIDGHKVKIEAGPQPVSAIKTAGGVPQAYVLDQLVNGRWVPLNDNETVEIEGKEEFDSHPPTGGAS